jgi:phosphoribosyl 1,2-cyclic phosphodiesterase
MAVGNVIVTVVDVGQGQCTFVEIYDDDGMNPELINTLLFDCGSDKESTQTVTNLDYIVARVNSMTTPGFDRIFFSHSDNDHISLAWYVLNEINKTQAPVIGEVWYGGAYSRYTKRGFNILDYIINSGFCSKKNVKGFNSNSTDYVTSSKSFEYYLWRSSDKTVHVYGIAANVLSDNPDWDDSDLDVNGKTAEALNRVSLIAGLYYNGASFITCGDATNKTMGAVNGLFSAGTTVFNNNKMTTIPHHGSRATGFAVPSSKKASDEAILVVDTFAAILKSKLLTVSAYQKHSHPSLQLMNRFIPTVTTPILRDPRLKQKNAHRITANIDIDLGTSAGFTIHRGADYSFEATTNTFSTRYFDGYDTFSYNLGDDEAEESDGVTSTAGAINGFACWQFTTGPAATTTVGGYANLGLPLAVFTSDIIASPVTDDGETTQIGEVQPAVRIWTTKRAMGSPAIKRPQVLTNLKQFR